MSQGALRPDRAVSLRTQLLPEALRQAHRLAALLEDVWVWAETMLTRSERPVTAATIDLVIDELLRRELANIIAAHEAAGPRTSEEADAALARLTMEVDELRDAGRRRDHAAAVAPVAEAARALGFGEPQDAETAALVPARGLEALRRAKTFAAALEAEGSVEAAAAAARIPDAVVAEARALDARRRVTLRDAVEAAVANAVSDDMRSHAKSHGRLLLEYFGEVALDALDEDALVGFLSGRGGSLSTTAATTASTATLRTRRRRGPRRRPSVRRSLRPTPTTRGSAKRSPTSRCRRWRRSRCWRRG